MANVQYVPPEEGQKTDLARVCILGEPGAGKTRLAATFPTPFFLDMEKGAASARAVHRALGVGGVPRSPGYDNESGGLTEWIAADSLNPLDSLSYLTNLPPTTLD